VTVRLAVLGDPLAYTRSPDLHRAGLAAVGLDGDSEAIVTPVASLGERLRDLAARGYRGVNLTTPLKTAALGQVARASSRATAARSVNTVDFEPEGFSGDTTDGAGFVAFLHAVGVVTAGMRVVLLGAGGAVRSMVSALDAAGAEVAIVARDPERARTLWTAPGSVAWHAWGSRGADEAIAAAGVVVQATPLEDPARLPDPARTDSDARLVDLRYGPEPTPWVRAARAAGRAADDGLGLLVCQARESLALWTGRAVPLEPLARAVGWLT